MVLLAHSGGNATLLLTSHDLVCPPDGRGETCLLVSNVLAPLNVARCARPRYYSTHAHLYKLARCARPQLPR